MRLFVRVVDTGSFSKAATEAGIGQPSATKLIAQLEKQLGSRLLHRSTRGVSPTEVGLVYYEKCRLIAQHVDEAESVAALMQSQLQGGLRISTTMDFGRRVLAPLLLQFMQANPKVQVELLFDDHLVNLVEQGIDVAIRMGKLADSSLGARYLGKNPWSLVASPQYIAKRGMPQSPQALASHDALICSSVQSDSRWHFHVADKPTGTTQELSVLVKGPMRSNNKSALMEAACAGFGIAALPSYVVYDAVRRGELLTLLSDWPLPTQEVHAVFPSPRMVPVKVSRFVDWLQMQLDEAWWTKQF